VFAKDALDKLLRDYEFQTVLDVGCGNGEHAAVFERHGKSVTRNDLRLDGAYQHRLFDAHDCVWCSHVLEHALNPHDFVTKLAIDCKEGGVIAITVPPLKHEIVGGHVNLFNAGLLLYRMALAGIDCKEAAVKSYDYNVSVIVRKRTFTVPRLAYDAGDVTTLTPYLPSCLTEGATGVIGSWNW
jgi:SAM-dependent methyltransferase